MLYILLISSYIATSHGQSDIDRAAEGLMMYYNNSAGIWDTTGWWNSANCLTAIIDYMLITGARSYVDSVENTFIRGEKYYYLSKGFRNFTDWYVDDSGWWGLAMVRAYDLTSDVKYLQMAQTIADFMYRYGDSVCNGGLYWTKKPNMGYNEKNAITNALYIKLSAQLYNRDNDKLINLVRAMELWSWFNSTGMITADHLVIDKLSDLATCSAGGTVFSYNQGVIVGALVELYHATSDLAYLYEAQAIAQAAMRSDALNPGGVLKEPGETDSCHGDGPSFKGAFVRNLAELSVALQDIPLNNGIYYDYLYELVQNVDTFDRSDNKFGNHWRGPVGDTGAACQQSALDLFNAYYSTRSHLMYDFM